MKYKELVQHKLLQQKYIYENPIGERWVSIGWVYYGPVFRYRYDPVPGIIRWRKSFRPYVRCMHTTQERRMTFAYEGYVRSKRNYTHLPHAWDDIWHARRERGWKRTKKKRQYMKKGDKLYHKTTYEY